MPKVALLSGFEGAADASTARVSVIAMAGAYSELFSLGCMRREIYGAGVPVAIHSDHASRAPSDAVRASSLSRSESSFVVVVPKNATKRLRGVCVCLFPLTFLRTLF